MNSMCKKTVEILRLTNDGSDLSPDDLFLSQGAINNNLTAVGIQAFNALHQQVVSGQYRRPWLHGIEHLTIDNEGVVYWKGQQVEHYCIGMAFSQKGKEAAEDLALRCRHLERLDVAVSDITAIWQWHVYKDQQPAPY